MKTVIRGTGGLGILHLQNISISGASGITDMPLPVGSMVFLQLTKSHFHGARVAWVNGRTIGLQLCRPMKAEILKRLLKGPRPPSTTN